MPTHVEPGVRLPIPLYETLRRMAEKNHRSLNAEILYGLEQYVQSFREYEQRRDSAIQELGAAGRQWIGPAVRHIGADATGALPVPPDTTVVERPGYYQRARIPNAPAHLNTEPF